MSYHDMPAIGGQVGDEGLEPTCVSPANNRGLRVTGIKAGPKAGLSVTAMPSHAVSAKSQTLENKAYHVMSYHDMPAIGGQVGDEGLEPPTSTV